jgi:hypothetical protein
MFERDTERERERERERKRDVYVCVCIYVRKAGGWHQLKIISNGELIVSAALNTVVLLPQY